MNITPMIRLPFTDLFASLLTYQNHPDCARHEMRVVECMEAYGLPRSKEKCRTLILDFQECVVGTKQQARCDIMMNERTRQWEAGERKVRYGPNVEANAF